MAGRIKVNVGQSIFHPQRRFRAVSWLHRAPVLISMDREGRLEMGRGMQLCILHFMIQIAIIDYRTQI